MDLPQTIVNYIHDKLGSLDKLLKPLEEKDVVEARIEIARTTKHHQKGNVYRAECNLRLPGKLLRGEEQDWDLRLAIDRVRDQLQDQISDYSLKMRPQDSRGQKILRKARGKN